MNKRDRNRHLRNVKGGKRGPTEDWAVSCAKQMMAAHTPPEQIADFLVAVVPYVTPSEPSRSLSSRR